MFALLANFLENVIERKNVENRPVFHKIRPMHKVLGLLFRPRSSGPNK